MSIAHNMSHVTDKKSNIVHKKPIIYKMNAIESLIDEEYIRWVEYYHDDIQNIYDNVVIPSNYKISFSDFVDLTYLCSDTYWYNTYLLG